MCKHKSGGMSKPSAASNEPPTLHRSPGISYTSQRESLEPNISISPPLASHSIPSGTIPLAMLDAQAKSSGLALTPATLQYSSTAEAMFRGNLNHSQYDKAKDRPTDSSPSSISQQVAEYEGSKSDSSDDEDGITELSPMLLSKTFGICYSQQKFQQVRNVRKYEMPASPCDPRGIEHNRLVASSKCSDKFYNCRRFDMQDFDGKFERTLSIPGEQTRTVDSSLMSCASCLTLSDSISHGATDDPSSLEESNNSFLTTHSSSTMNTDPIPGPSGFLPRRNSIHWEIGNFDGEKDEEFRGRSYSLTPTVNFAVFESESASENEDNDNNVFLPNIGDDKPSEEQYIEKTATAEEQIQIPVSSFHKIFHISPSAAQLSIASSYGDSGASICKICHTTAKENDPLISPCRCSGTMQYIHCGCLMRWLEISSKRSRKPASCELCQYQYHWHKKFKVRQWQFPHCSRRDKILHFLFFFSMFVMVACATITILCFKQDKGTKLNPDRTELTQSEIITLVCGVTFFLAFFVAMYVEVKSRTTIYKLLVKFIYLNQQWYIDEYEKKETAPVPV